MKWSPPEVGDLKEKHTGFKHRPPVGSNPIGASVPRARLRLTAGLRSEHPPPVGLTARANDLIEFERYVYKSEG